MVWQAVLERVEQQMPAAVMTRLVLEQALPTGWIDDVFERHRQRQYSRELLFSTVVELMTLVTLGLRPSLHAAARKLNERLPAHASDLVAKSPDFGPTRRADTFSGGLRRCKSSP